MAIKTPQVKKPVKTRVQSIVLLLRKDPKYKRLKTTFATHENFRIDLPTLLEELETSHKIRKVRRLNPTDPEFVDKLIDASLDDQSKRSRATEILIRCVRSHSLLLNAVDNLRYHLLTTYSNELRPFSTKEERLQVVKMALRTFDVFLANVTVVKDSANLIVIDIDKSAWTLKGVVQAMELHVSRERHI